MSSLSENSRRYSSYKNGKKDNLDLNYDSDFSIHKNKKKPTNTRRARSSRSSSRSRSRSPSSSTRTGSNLKKKDSNKLSNTFTKSQLKQEKRRGYSSRSRSRTRSSSSVSRSRTPTPEIEYRKQMEKQKSQQDKSKNPNSKTSFHSSEDKKSTAKSLSPLVQITTKSESYSSITHKMSLSSLAKNQSLHSVEEVQAENSNDDQSERNQQHNAPPDKRKKEISLLEKVQTTHLVETELSYSNTSASNKNSKTQNQIETYQGKLEKSFASVNSRNIENRTTPTLVPDPIIENSKSTSFTNKISNHVVDSDHEHFYKSSSDINSLEKEKSRILGNNSSQGSAILSSSAIHKVSNYVTRLSVPPSHTSSAKSSRADLQEVCSILNQNDIFGSRTSLIEKQHEKLKDLIGSRKSSIKFDNTNGKKHEDTMVRADSKTSYVSIKNRLDNLVIEKSSLFSSSKINFDKDKSVLSNRSRHQSGISRKTQYHEIENLPEETSDLNSGDQSIKVSRQTTNIFHEKNESNLAAKQPFSDIDVQASKQSTNDTYSNEKIVPSQSKNISIDSKKETYLKNNKSKNSMTSFRQFSGDFKNPKELTAYSLAVKQDSNKDSSLLTDITTFKLDNQKSSVSKIKSDSIKSTKLDSMEHNKSKVTVAATRQLSELSSKKTSGSNEVKTTILKVNKNNEDSTFKRNQTLSSKKSILPNKPTIHSSDNSEFPLSRITDKTEKREFEDSLKIDKPIIKRLNRADKKPAAIYHSLSRQGSMIQTVGYNENMVEATDSPITQFDERTTLLSRRASLDRSKLEKLSAFSNDKILNSDFDQAKASLSPSLQSYSDLNSKENTITNKYNQSSNSGSRITKENTITNKYPHSTNSIDKITKTTANISRIIIDPKVEKTLTFQSLKKSNSIYSINRFPLEKSNISRKLTNNEINSINHKNYSTTNLNKEKSKSFSVKEITKLPIIQDNKTIKGGRKPTSRVSSDTETTETTETESDGNEIDIPNMENRMKVPTFVNNQIEKQKIEDSDESTTYSNYEEWQNHDKTEDNPKSTMYIVPSTTPALSHVDTGELKERRKKMNEKLNIDRKASLRPNKPSDSDSSSEYENESCEEDSEDYNDDGSKRHAYYQNKNSATEYSESETDSNTEDYDREPHILIKRQAYELNFDKIYENVDKDLELQEQLQEEQRRLHEEQEIIKKKIKDDQERIKKEMMLKLGELEPIGVPVAYQGKSKAANLIKPKKLQAPIYSKPVPLNKPIVLVNNKPVCVSSENQKEEKYIPTNLIKHSIVDKSVTNSDRSEKVRSNQSLEKVNRSLEAVNRSLESVHRQIELANEKEIKPSKHIENRAHWNQYQTKGPLIRRAANFNKNVYGRAPPRKPQPKQNPVPTGDINQATRQVLSAQRFKNNELQNKLTEVMNELEELKVENKTLKRVHIREEIALKKHENQDIDLAKMMKTHQEELTVVKDLNRKQQKENKRITALLMEREEDLRAYKKKADEMKKIINDKKLLDSVEITRKLEIFQKEMEEYKEKSEKQSQKIELLEKNHKHEMGVEIAAQRDLKRRLQILSDENNELKVKLEEKERALDIANIYTNRQIPFDKQTSNWKGSTLSLQGNQTPSETPRNRSRIAADRKRREIKHPGPLKENEITPSPTITSDRRLADDSPVSKDYQAQNGHNDKEEIEDDYEEVKRANKKLEIEAKIMQQEADLKQKDAAERAKREREADEYERKRKMEEKLRLEEEERIQQEKKRMEEKQKREEEEKRQKKQEEEREQERREKEKRLKEEEQRKRYISPQLISSLEEKEKSLEEKTKKDDLLAKLGFMENTKKNVSPTNNNTIGNNNSNNYNSFNSNNYNDSATLSSKQPANQTMNSNSMKFVFDDKTENLHKGKSVIDGRDNGKNELLSKLFSNDGTLNNKPNNNKGDDDFFGSLKNNDINKKKSTTDSSSKISMLPWEAQEVNYNNQQIQREKSRGKIDSSNSNYTGQSYSNKSDSPKNDHIDFFSTLNGGLSTKKKTNDFSSTNGFNRPKMDNKPVNLFSNSKASGSYVEDIEELSI